MTFENFILIYQPNDKPYTNGKLLLLLENRTT
jgi:hypothetical protein